MSILVFMLVLGGLGVAAYGAAMWYANDVETPSYNLVSSEAEFEIRDYPALVVAEVVRRGDRNSAVSEAFRPLANYIFAKERNGEPIAMTAPVTQAMDDAGQSWTVRFVMPSQYTLDTLPNPQNAEIRLVDVPAGRRAAIRFSGIATDELIGEKEGMLRAWLQRHGVVPLGPATYAYYNAPFIPGFLRRNEVLFDVAGD